MRIGGFCTTIGTLMGLHQLLFVCLRQACDYKQFITTVLTHSWCWSKRLVEHYLLCLFLKHFMHLDVDSYSNFFLWFTIKLNKKGIEMILDRLRLWI